MKTLKLEERNLIRRYAEFLPFAERNSLLADLEVAKVKETSPNGALITFEIPNYEQPPYRGQHAFEVEGKLLDQDGAAVSAILYADENNRLYELEFVRWDAGEIIELQWGTLEIYG